MTAGKADPGGITFPTPEEAAADPALCRNQGEVDFIRIIRAASEDERASIMHFTKRVAGGTPFHTASIELLLARGYDEAEARQISDRIVAAGDA